MILAICAAAAQSVRFALQKTLSLDGLSATGATWARFVYSAPLVLAVVVLYLGLTGRTTPNLADGFAGWAVIGGLSQILATVLTLALFRLRAFAIGITFKKTEVLITALAGWVLLGDRITLSAGAAILLGFLGVLLLSRTPGEMSFDRRSVTLGLGSGLFFALSAVGYRAATLRVETDDTFLAAGLALGLVTSGQAVAMALWLSAVERGQITATLAEWRKGLLVGVTSLTGSWCWFAAFSLANAAYVFAVGQVELIFSLAIGALWFGERIGRREAAGMAVLTASIIGIAFLT